MAKYYFEFPKAIYDLVKEFESLHDGDLKTIGLQPKLCPANVWTEGYGRAMVNPRTKGHLRGIENKRIAYASITIYNEKEALQALKEDLWYKGGFPAMKEIGDDAWDDLNDVQKGALASFVYNCGTGLPKYKIFKNVLAWLKKDMSNEDLYKYWCSSVIRGGGVVLKGLQRRREKEARVFLGMV
jgi:lysozyme